MGIRVYIYVRVCVYMLSFNTFRESYEHKGQAKRLFCQLGCLSGWLQKWVEGWADLSGGKKPASTFPLKAVPCYCKSKTRILCIAENLNRATDL